jgi:predicted outer membrane repeat protein
VFRDCQAFLGGAIHVMKIVGEPDNVYPVITDCVFEGCSANDGSPNTDNNGGAILFINSHPTVTDCLFDDNHSSSYGGAIYAHTCTGTFDGCTFIENGSIHGGAFCLVYTDIDLEHTIVANTASGVGIKAFNGSTINFDCDDFWNNSGGSIWGIDSTTVDVNTIFADPIFCDPGSNDYTLNNVSPCAAANSPCGIQMGVYGVGCTGPVVTVTDPPQNDIDVSSNMLIMIDFDRPMDSLTMDNSTVFVTGEFSGPIEVVMVYWWWSKQLLIDPLSPLREGEVITYVLTDGITDENGSPLSEFIGEFTVESNDDNDGIYGPQTAYTEGDMARCIYTADYNGDGELDLAVANYSHNNVSVRMGNGDGTFCSRVTYGTGTQPWAVVSADFDGDDDMDLASSNYGTEDVTVLMNNGSGSFTFDANYPVGTDPHAILTADLNGDAAPDLVTTNLYSYDVSVLINNGDGTYASEVRYDVSNGPIAIDAADLDNDGDLDLFVVCYFLSKIALLLNNGDGTFAPCTLIDNSGGPFSIAAAGLDDDGDLDMAVANRGSNDVSVHVNLGDGTFAGPVDYTVGEDPYYVTAADLDGDSDIDLVTANLDWNSVSVLMNNGDATYASQVTYPVNGGPLWVIDADFNNDGRLDLAVANCFSDNVSILLNTYVADGPVLVSPYDGYSTYSHSITLNWEDYSGATSYEVMVDNDPFFGSPDRWETGLLVSQWLITPNLGHAKWYWKVRAQTAAGPSNWSYMWDFTIKDRPDPSCPVLYTYNGVDFIQENPLLTACEKSGYVDVVTDYYHVTKGVTPKDNIITFQLRELEDEETFLYNLELITVDHPAGTRIACDVDGQVTVFDRLKAPLSAIDNNGVNRLAELSSEDGILFKVPESGYIDLVYEGEDDDFGILFGAPPKNFCPDPEDPMPLKAQPDNENQYTPTQVTVSYKDNLGNWTEYSDIPPRDQLVNTYVSGEWMTGGAETITIRIAWEGSYATDAIFKVIPVQQEPDVQTHPIIRAELMTETGAEEIWEMSDDGSPITMVKGNVFEFDFEIDAVGHPDIVRDYIIRAVGRYQPNYNVYTRLLPGELKLHANYPNPFNPVTTLSYDLPVASNVCLEIYNITGQLVTTLADGWQEAGRHQVTWNSTDENGQPVASGIYFYQLKTADFVQSKKMILLK